MVANLLDPILLFALPMGVAFLLPLIDKLGRSVTHAVHLLVLAAMFGLTGWWTWQLAHGMAPIEIQTGGWAPPIGIALRLGVTEGLLALFAQGAALFGAVYLWGREEHGDIRAIALQLALVVGALGLFMTRDLFNIFVFVEITGIATYALAMLGREDSALEAGFKYMLMGSAASIFLLLGIALLYKHTGHLNLDAMQAALAQGSPAALSVALGLVFMLVLVSFAAELKLFPVNGPGLDMYEGVDPGVSALMVVTSVNGYLYAFYKVLAVFPAEWGTTVSVLGMVTFVGANLMANRQTQVRRMLGYSSSAQVGLLVALLPMVRAGHVHMLPVLLLIANHTFAKSALLWLAGQGEKLSLVEWRGVFSGRTIQRLTLTAAVLAITGLPPFPGFFGKWEVLTDLSAHGGAWWIGAILLGSLLEFGYYFKWLHYAHQGEESDVPQVPVSAQIAPALSAAVLLVGGLGMSLWRFPELANLSLPVAVLLGAGLALVLVRELSSVVSSGLALLVVLGVVGVTVGAGLELNTLAGLFTALALAGGTVTAIAALSVPTLKGAYHGLFLLLLSSVLMVVQSEHSLTFFVGWELMTWTSYLLIAQGREGARPAWVYMLFSGAAGFLLLGGLLVGYAHGVDSFSGMEALTGSAQLAAWSLLVLGILVKIGTVGAHVWAPDAYTESPDVYTAFLSGVISKVPVFALVLVLAHLGTGALTMGGYTFELHHLVAWLGGLTALGMSLLALFQEDAKKLLAYSSVGQLGYVVAGVAILSPLGWAAGLYHAVHHLGFKAMLLLVLAGVIHRTGTRKMYEMGGLIARMPLSFFIAMIGIIALAGVPPLGGFVGKWLLYNALVEEGWLFLAALMMFSSLVAFLYLYRFIHTIFLGQLKTRHREIKEAPLPYLLAEVALLGLVGLVSVWPQAVLSPVNAIAHSYLGGRGLGFEGELVFPGGVVRGSELVTSFGSYDPVVTMLVVALVFVLSAGLLWVSVPRARRVGQLDIAFAGEVPPPPEEIHFAFDFHRPYERVFGAVLRGQAVKFWRGFGDAVEAIAETSRGIYSGDGQTYLVYFFGLAVLLGALQMGL
ncbi:MAG: hypothetical protein JXX28_09045 [Deltaproteobacteria bacterium]|nr:hypothetical protein [Deltaproteobacteria bacterium]